MIKTRYDDMKLVVIDDLHTKQCNICGHKEYTDDSLETIKIIKAHLLKEVEELNHQKERENEKEKSNPFLKLFKFFGSR